MLVPACKEIGCNVGMIVEDWDQEDIFDHDYIARLPSFALILENLTWGLSAIDFAAHDTFPWAQLAGAEFSRLETLYLHFNPNDPDVMEVEADREDLSPIEIAGFWQYLWHLLQTNTFPALRVLKIQALTYTHAIFVDLALLTQRMPNLATLNLHLTTTDRTGAIQPQYSYAETGPLHELNDVCAKREITLTQRTMHRKTRRDRVFAPSDSEE